MITKVITTFLIGTIKKAVSIIISVFTLTTPITDLVKRAKVMKFLHRMVAVKLKCVRVVQHLSMYPLLKIAVLAIVIAVNLVILSLLALFLLEQMIVVAIFSLQLCALFNLVVPLFLETMVVVTLSHQLCVPLTRFAETAKLSVLLLVIVAIVASAILLTVHLTVLPRENL
jgi:hypothetical protein